MLNPMALVSLNGFRKMVDCDRDPDIHRLSSRIVDCLPPSKRLDILDTLRPVTSNEGCSLIDCKLLSSDSDGRSPSNVGGSMSALSSKEKNEVAIFYQKYHQKCLPNTTHEQTKHMHSIPFLLMNTMKYFGFILPQALFTFS